ncbi:hypothetical protein G3I60_05150 [Streptomyces sp. SID13666]|uniref:hypothetical protein n=1 Tax=Streptomyces sp. SID13666 TaxID=2706054 RepID=UPI0013BF465F|nr:hypothetical protein [Streptomyces sp. SID13666]NEA53557.1 hypothetical protein [Streptomyces sp. SID13666]
MNTTASGDVESPQLVIEEYAREHNLLIVARYLDREGAAPPEEKAGLQGAINAVRSGRARHLLVVDHSAISPLISELDAVRADVRRARGVVTAVGWPAVDPAAWGAAVPYQGSGRPIGL